MSIGEELTELTKRREALKSNTAVVDKQIAAIHLLDDIANAMDNPPGFKMDIDTLARMTVRELIDRWPAIIDTTEIARK